MQRMCSTQPASFVRVDDFMTSEEINRDPVRKSASAFGVGSHVCTSIAMPSGELVLFVFQRWLRDGIYDQAAIDRLDELRPHLARAGLIAGRLGLERARTTVSALEEIGLPAAVMAGSGRVLTANSLLETMTGVFLPLAHGGMALAHKSANALFQQAIARIYRPGQSRHVTIHVCVATGTVDEMKRDRVLGKMSAQEAFRRHLERV